jgi:hypothetical protein
LTASAGTATGASAEASSLVPLAGTGSAQTGEFTPWDGSAGDEFAGAEDEEGAVGGTGDNLLGTCGGASHGPGTRAALGNWSTRISKLTP